MRPEGPLQAVGRALSPGLGRGIPGYDARLQRARFSSWFSWGLALVVLHIFEVVRECGFNRGHVLGLGGFCEGVARERSRRVRWMTCSAYCRAKAMNRR